VKAQVVFLSAQGMGRAPVEEAEGLFRAVESRFGHSFEMSALDAGHEPWSPEVLATCRAAPAVFAWVPSENEGSARRQLHWRLRRELGVSARVRPLRGSLATVAGRIPRAERQRALDVLLVSEGGEVESADRQEHRLKEVARVAADLAQRRWGLLTVVQVGSEEDARFREALAHVPSLRVEVAGEEGVIERLQTAPGSLDVILAEGRAAEALSERAGAASFQGLSAFVGEQGRGLYPLPGPAVALGVLSVAMALRCSLGLEREATAVEGALGAAWVAGTTEGSALWEAVRGNLSSDLTNSLAI
jgi:3-isopropylmalate dehydrogenase